MSAQQILLAKYGQPNHDYIIKYCEVWAVKNDYPWFPAHSFLVNKDFKSKLWDFFWALQYNGCYTEIKAFDGCYNDRSVRGMQTQSLHSWASAIDLNAAENPMVEKPLEQITAEDRLGKWTQKFVDTISDCGLFYGGNFIHRPDPMHLCQFNG